MTSGRIPASIRAQLRAEAGDRCGYCKTRRQLWARHFRWGEDGVRIEGLTACGRATVIALHLNNPYAVETRRYWNHAGWHPPEDEPR